MQIKLVEAEEGDEELNSFLFPPGYYTGEPITVVSHLKNTLLDMLNNVMIHLKCRRKMIG